MSMRATFTTEFIYDGDTDYLKRKAKLCKIFGVEMNLKGGNVIGQISGITSGLDLAEEDIRRWIAELCYELGKATKVPFKIVWLLEGGDLICKEIQPSKSQEENK